MKKKVITNNKLLFISLILIANFNYSNPQNEIRLIIEGNNTQNFLSNDFNFAPSEVIVNGIQKQSCQNQKYCELEDDKINNITLIFNTQITSCKNMFKSLENITEIDLSNLNTSQVTSMESMFNGCKKLSKIIFGNINTSAVTNMYSLFTSCEKLKSLDLSNFDTSSVTTMQYAFQFLLSEEFLDLSNFNTSKVENMQDMFSKSTKIYTINLSSFDTSNVKTMRGMFLDCSNLKYLDLSNFNFISVTDFQYMFGSNRGLIYINFKNLIIGSDANTNAMFYYAGRNHKICINDSYSNNFLSEKFTNSYNCSDICFEKTNIKVDSKTNLCIKSCNESDYKFEYNNVCFDKCPDNTYALFNNYEYLCVHNIPLEEYYLDINDNIYKKCYDTCKYCYGEGNDTYHNCYECINNFNFLNESNTYDNNCYEKCEYFYYFDSLNNYKCTNKSKCPQMFNKYFENKNKCIDECKNDFKFKYMYNNTCYEECPNNTYIIYKYICEDYIINNNNSLYINEIEYIITSELNITEIEENDLLFTNDNITYTITTSSNQKNNSKYKNVSTIDLGDCEIKLKKGYNIPLNDSLFILKIDIPIEYYKISKIEYEVYYPLYNGTLSKLDLSICQDIKINKSIPIKLSKNELDLYNASSDMYNDLCYSLAENGVDKTLKDRKNDFINNNMTVCEEKCQFIDYDYDNFKAICYCPVQEKVIDFYSIKVDTNLLLNSFKDINNIGNFKMIKCIHLLLDTKNIFKNSANYLFIVLFILFIITIFVFILHDFLNIIKIINDIYKKRHPNKDNKAKIKKGNNNIITDLIDSNKENKTKNPNNKLNINSNKKSNNNFLNKSKTIKNIQLKSKQNRTVILNINKNYIHLKRKRTRQNININNKNNIPFKNSSKEYSMIKLNQSKKNENANKKIFIDISYIDSELNALKYEDAFKNDKRTCFQYYFSLLRTKHLFILTFCNNKDYNSRIIKIYIFFFNFILNFTVNALFYTDDLMHKIYIEQGTFNFIYQIPQIILSATITAVLNLVINKLGLSQKNILEMKSCRIGNIEKIKDKELNSIKCKIVLFFIIIFILLVFCWIFLGCFCSVYKNTQIHLIIEVLSSFGTSCITPFFINIIPCLFRIPSLNRKKKDRKCLYNFSKIIQMI